jgi:hypothetical protein
MNIFVLLGVMEASPGVMEAAAMRSTSPVEVMITTGTCGSQVRPRTHHPQEMPELLARPNSWRSLVQGRLGSGGGYGLAAKPLMTETSTKNTRRCGSIGQLVSPFGFMAFVSQ